MIAKTARSPPRPPRARTSRRIASAMPAITARLAARARRAMPASTALPGRRLPGRVRTALRASMPGAGHSPVPTARRAKSPPRLVSRRAQTVKGASIRARRVPACARPAKKASSPMRMRVPPSARHAARTRRAASARQSAPATPATTSPPPPASHVTPAST
jgi:hypothetical protein